jgi:asparagine synthase (glutamine-hydrolysing)
MSAQIGIWNRDGSPVAPAEDPQAALAMLLPYGPDGQEVHLDTGLAFGYAAFHTTRESRIDPQPLVLPDCLVVTWDGRLDNLAELNHDLGDDAPQTKGEAAIVAAAYLRWGTECFARLHGDWALVIWDAKARTLLLGRDFLGTRPLYYRVTSRQVMWGTLIDPLVATAGYALTLNAEYIAGWLSSLPAAHLTPYTEIAAVPPASYVAVSSAAHRIVKYWEFDPFLKIRYRRDDEYEEHFRESFARSVQRRLRSDLPVLAHLSGGMDSSSIVCMADHLSAAGLARPERVETVSYYTDDEPNWNERPWFEKVEESRGKKGLHIDVSPGSTSNRKWAAGPPPFLPGSARFAAPPDLAAWIGRTGCRVLLSGFGGDEVTGGVPTPVPELQNLLARARLIAFARQLHTWAVWQKRPWIRLLWETLREFLPRAVTSSGPEGVAIWFKENAVRLTAAMRRESQERLKLFGPPPSLRANLQALDELQRMVSCSTVPVAPLLDRRYPFLDRDLLSFLFAIPRDQMVRPGQRRSLMRRALKGIVPDQILNRRRKAYVSRLPIITIEQCLTQHVSRNTETWLSRLDFVDDRKLHACLEEVCRRRQSPSMRLLRATGVEVWLEELGRSGTLSVDAAGRGRLNFSVSGSSEAETVAAAEAFHGSI